MSTVLHEIERALKVKLRAGPKVAGCIARVAPCPDWLAAVAAIEPRCLAWAKRGLTVLVGGGRLIAVEGVDPIALMEAFEVGSHNDFDGRTPRKAQEAMRRVLDEAPFVPYFADAAGFKVRFAEPVGAETARRIELEVGRFDPEACELIDAPSLAASIRRTQRLELWWD